MALNGLVCADVPLSNYSLTHSLTSQACTSGYMGSTKLTSSANRALENSAQELRRRR